MDSTPRSSNPTASLGPDMKYLNRVNSSDFVAQANAHKQRHKEMGLVQRYAIKLHDSYTFTHSIGIVIVLNMFVMIIETDRSAREEKGSSSKLYWTDVFSWSALLVFIFELTVRLLAFRCSFWKDPWNVFDFIVVVVDGTFSVAGLIVGSSFPVSILRIFRLVKLARVSKMLRVFPELRLIMAALARSISAIFWGAFLLVVVLLVWAMVAVLLIHPLNKEMEYDDCERCPRAYSSVMHATLTFWQLVVIADGWGDLAIPLMETYPTTILFFVPMFLSAGMAVVNLILGVVVNVAMEAKDDLQLEDHTEQAMQKLEKESQLLELCTQMDSSRSGRLSQSDMLMGFRTPGQFRDCILALGITEEDFDIVWALMDSDNRGTVSYKRFVNSLSSLRSSQSQFMLAYIKYYMVVLKNTVLQQMQKNHKETMSGEQELEDQIQDLKATETNIFDVLTADSANHEPKDREEQLLTESIAELKENDDAILTKLEDITLNLKPESSLGGDILRKRVPSSDRAKNDTSDHANLGAICDVASASTSEEAEIWLSHICGEITRVLRIELDQVLIDMKSKFCQQPSVVSAKNPIITRSRPGKLAL